MTTTKNKTKGDSFTYAYGRINESIEAGFYLEAVTLAESVISDRLYSFVKHHDGKVKKSTALKQLINKAKKLNTLHTTKYGDSMFEALDIWRDQRNKCVHSVAKSEPGEPTTSVEDFIALAKKSASNGKKLARLVCNWHRDARK